MCGAKIIPIAFKKCFLFHSNEKLNSEEYY